MKLNKKVVGGQILDKVSYYIRNPVKLTKLDGEIIDAFPSIAFNPNSKSAAETARSWCGDECYNNLSERKFVELSNEPIYVTITGLDIRSEGGRAYQVIDDDNRIFDLREDQLLEAVQSHGIQAGGKILAPFIWGILGSQIRLMVHNGKMHNEIISLLNAKNEKNKLAENFKPEPGDLCEDTNGRTYFYIGKCMAPNEKKSSHVFMYMLNVESFDDYINYCVDNSIKGQLCDHIELRSKLPKAFVKSKKKADLTTIELIKRNPNGCFYYVNGVGHRLDEKYWNKHKWPLTGYGRYDHSRFKTENELAIFYRDAIKWI